MDTVDPLRFVLAFLFVVGLIGALGVGLRRYGRGRTAPGWKMFSVKDDSGRIQVAEVRYIDPRRRLVLIRRDDVEHLLLLADGRELVIESGIRAVMMPAEENDVR